MRWSDLNLDLFNDDDGDGDIETDDGDDLENGGDEWNEGASNMI